jgi:membrane protease subunit HflC
MSRKRLLQIGGALLLLLGLASAVFTIDPTEFAVVTQFGRPVRAVVDPGLHLKWPDPVQSVTVFDRRLQVLGPPSAEFLTQDKKNVQVESYVTWRIGDPVAYLKTLRTTVAATDRMTDVVFSELGVALGQFPLGSLITVDPAAGKLGEMLAQVTRSSAEKVRPYGLEIGDVRLKAFNFPEKNKLSVFQRMKAEREKQARLYRSEGNEAATKIRAEADKERALILAKANETALQTRGEAEAQAVRIYAQAFQQDPQFYQFTRSLQAYEKLINEKTTLIVPANSELLKYLDKVPR